MQFLKGNFQGVNFCITIMHVAEHYSLQHFYVCVFRSEREAPCRIIKSEIMTLYTHGCAYLFFYWRTSGTAPCELANVAVDILSSSTKPIRILHILRITYGRERPMGVNWMDIMHDRLPEILCSESLVETAGYHGRVSSDLLRDKV